MGTCTFSEKPSSGIKHLEPLVHTEQIYWVSLFNLPPLSLTFIYSALVLEFWNILNFNNWTYIHHTNHLMKEKADQDPAEASHST